MSASVQPAGVAGMFYPADAATLAAGVDASLVSAQPPPLIPKAVIAPHAGHVYSGDIAGTAYKLLSRRKGEVKRVILLGPNHRVPVRGMALSPATAWDTPLGPLPVDRASRDLLARTPDIAVTAEPFAGEHSLEVHLPFIHRSLGEVEILPILVGDAPVAQVSSALESLWGGPETVIIVSSDLSHYHDYETCKAKDGETAAGIERLQPAICEGDRACGYHSIRGLIDQAQRRDMRVTALDVRNSGDTRGTRDRVVGYGSFAFEYAHSAQVDENARKSLLDLAREVVKQATLHDGTPPRLNLQGQLPASLKAQRATFVTISVGGQLRGCRGTLLPQRPLLFDVADNAWQAGFKDPRFPPVVLDDVPRLEFHVSILSTPRRIPCCSEEELVRALRPDIDGLVLREGAKQGTLLPSVWSQLHDPLTFVRQLKLKAGLPADHWSPMIEAYRYGTESFGSHAEAV
jgi:AmmeMemoRadiSam system protein B/AmmeMemoRadiSam system protein A